MPTIHICNEVKSKYYCYLHKRKDGSIFYVGKGTYNRATEILNCRRSLWHTHIVEKEGKDNIIIELIPALNEADAFRLEKLYIAFLAPCFKLCNLTEGGEGTSGYRHTEETKKRIIASNTGQIRSDTTKARIKQAKSITSDITRQKMSLGQLGKIKGPCSEERKRRIGLANSNPSQETRDKAAKNRAIFAGESNANAKLTWEIAEEIRHLYSLGEVSQRNLAMRFGISHGRVYLIIHNKAWVRR